MTGLSHKRLPKCSQIVPSYGVLFFRLLKCVSPLPYRTRHVMSCHVNRHEGPTIAVTLIKDTVLTIPLRKCYFQ